LKELMIMCENNPKSMLLEFETKGQGIARCLDFYTTSREANLTMYASHILCLYCIEGFVSEINQKGIVEFLNTLLRNFTAEDEKFRI